MRKIINAYRIYSYSGFRALANAVFSFFTNWNHSGKGYTQYDFDFSPLKIQGILEFLIRMKAGDKDLIFVPEIYKERIRKNFKGSVVSTLDVISDHKLSEFTRLILASERVDKNARIARSFYKASKSVAVLTNTGPARVWMHDENKEKVLRSEFESQSCEGIEKFGHGIGADFGNLLQFIDNAKSLKGDFVEIGCFMGSSTCVMANYMEQNEIEKNFFVYDFFDGFTYDEALNSLDSTWANTHRTDGKDRVEERVKRRLSKQVDKFHFIQRNIIDDDALREVDSISFANIDVDLYEAVYAALCHVHKKLCVNGIVVVEDAGHTPLLIGAKVALEEFLDLVGRSTYNCIQMESGQYVLIKR